MADTLNPTKPQVRKLDTAKVRQARNTGVVLIFLSVLVAYVFAFGTSGDAVFRLSRPNDQWRCQIWSCRRWHSVTSRRRFCLSWCAAIYAWRGQMD